MNINDIVLEKYRIVSLISGDGTNRRGMSNLYKVEDIHLGSYWALKEVIKNADGTVSINQSSLIKESQILKKLNHPSIPRITSIDYLPDRILILMDWVDGKSVGEWVRIGGAMSVSRGVAITKSVCNILSYLHSREPAILYRDMKPENIMYDIESKRTVLLDYGISVEIDPTKPIADGDRHASRGYYDPYSLGRSVREVEQGVAPRYFDLRSDIYSLGWTMFHIFTGIRPYNYQKKKKSLDAPITRDIREFNKNLSPALADIIIKATEPNPDDRFQTIEELLFALEDIDKLDKGTYKVLRRKINTVLGIGVAGLGLMVASVAPYMSYEASLKNEYATLVANASKTGNFDDYIKVLEYDPRELNPYFGLIDAIKEDGVFSEEEERTFLDLVNPNLTILEKDSRYQEFAFEVGRLYWLYYTGNSSSSTEGGNSNSPELIASRWFKDAEGFSDLAKVYASIGSFEVNIIKAANEGTDMGLYAEQWKLLDSVTGQSELVTLQIAKARLGLINSYIYRLKADGITLEQLNTQLNAIEKLINETKEVSGRQGTLALELVPLLAQAKEVVGGAYV